MFCSFRVKKLQYAAVAHLVERHLAKVEVASSSLVARSNKKTFVFLTKVFCFIYRVTSQSLRTVSYTARSICLSALAATCGFRFRRFFRDP